MNEQSRSFATATREQYPHLGVANAVILELAPSLDTEQAARVGQALTEAIARKQAIVLHDAAVERVSTAGVQVIFAGAYPKVLFRQLAQ